MPTVSTGPISLFILRICLLANVQMSQASLNLCIGAKWGEAHDFTAVRVARASIVSVRTLQAKASELLRSVPKNGSVPGQLELKEWVGTATEIKAWYEATFGDIVGYLKQLDADMLELALDLESSASSTFTGKEELAHMSDLFSKLDAMVTYDVEKLYGDFLDLMQKLGGKGVEKILEVLAIEQGTREELAREERQLERSTAELYRSLANIHVHEGNLHEAELTLKELARTQPRAEQDRWDRALQLSESFFNAGAIVFNVRRGPVSLVGRGLEPELTQSTGIRHAMLDEDESLQAMRAEHVKKWEEEAAQRKKLSSDKMDVELAIINASKTVKRLEEEVKISKSKRNKFLDMLSAESLAFADQLIECIQSFWEQRNSMAALKVSIAEFQHFMSIWRRKAFDGLRGRKKAAFMHEIIFRGWGCFGPELSLFSQSSEDLLRAMAEDPHALPDMDAQEQKFTWTSVLEEAIALAGKLQEIAIAGNGDFYRSHFGSKISQERST